MFFRNVFWSSSGITSSSSGIRFFWKFSEKSVFRDDSGRRFFLERVFAEGHFRPFTVCWVPQQYCWVHVAAPLSRIKKSCNKKLKILKSTRTQINLSLMDDKWLTICCMMDTYKLKLQDNPN